MTRTNITVTKLLYKGVPVNKVSINFSRTLSNIPHEEVADCQSFYSDGNLRKDGLDSPLHTDHVSCWMDFSYLVASKMVEDTLEINVFLAGNTSVDVLQHIPLFTSEVFNAIVAVAEAA